MFDILCWVVLIIVSKVVIVLIEGRNGFWMEIEFVLLRGFV